MPDRYTRQDVEAFLHTPGRANGRIGRPPSAGTVSNRLSVISSFYSYASGYLISDDKNELRPLMTRAAPTLGLERPQRTQSYRTISFEDFERLFSVIPTDSVMGLRDRALILFLFWTAQRRAVACNLRWGDLYQSTAIENGVQRQIWMYTFSGKGYSRQKDHAELPQPAKDALDKYLIAAGRMGHMQHDDAVFTVLPDYIGQRGYDPKRPLAPNTVWNIVKRYAKLANIDPTITVHSLRHMATQQRALAGEDIRSLQRLLRHKSLQTTCLYLQGLMGTSDPAHKLLLDKFGKF